MEQKFIELFTRIEGKEKHLISYTSGNQHKIFITDNVFGLLSYNKYRSYVLVFEINGNYKGAANYISGIKDWQYQKVNKAFLERIQSLARA